MEHLHSQEVRSFLGRDATEGSRPGGLTRGEPRVSPAPHPLPHPLTCLCRRSNPGSKGVSSPKEDRGPSTPAATLAPLPTRPGLRRARPAVPPGPRPPSPPPCGQCSGVPQATERLQLADCLVTGPAARGASHVGHFPLDGPPPVGEAPVLHPLRCHRGDRATRVGMPWDEARGALTLGRRRGKRPWPQGTAPAGSPALWTSLCASVIGRRPCPGSAGHGPVGCRAPGWRAAVPLPVLPRPRRARLRLLPRCAARRAGGPGICATGLDTQFWASGASARKQAPGLVAEATGRRREGSRACAGLPCTEPGKLAPCHLSPSLASRPRGSLSANRASHPRTPVPTPAPLAQDLLPWPLLQPHALVQSRGLNFSAR